MNKLRLPNHFEAPIRQALDEFAKEGFHFDVTRMEIDPTYIGYNQLTLELEADAHNVFRLGVKVGAILEREDADAREGRTERIALLKDNQKNWDMGHLTPEEYQNKIEEINKKK